MKDMKLSTHFGNQKHETWHFNSLLFLCSTAANVDFEKKKIIFLQFFPKSSLKFSYPRVFDPFEYINLGLKSLKKLDFEIWLNHILDRKLKESGSFLPKFL